MNKRWKKIAVFFFAFTLVIGCVNPTDAYAKTTTKTEKQYVTRAYVLQQVEKLIGATQTSTEISKVKDVKKGSSYYKTMSIALKAGLVKADSERKLYPTKKATNKYVASVLAKVSETTTTKMLGKKKASAKLTKKDLTAFLKQKYPNVVKKSNAKVRKGNVVISKPVTLSNATVTGDLIIGDGVADKEVTLDNVTVKGKAIVRGGGENSIIISGNSSISNMVIRQVNNKVSIKVKGDAKVSMVYINDGSNDVNIVGQVGSLNVVGKNLTVTLVDATVNTLTVAESAKNASIVTDKDSTVKEVTLNAVGTKLTGDGKAETVNVNANDTTVTVNNEKINTKEGVTPPKTEETTQPTPDPEKPSTDDNPKPGETTGGGSSTGGSTGGGSSTGGSAGGGSSTGGSAGGGSSTGGSTGGGSSTGGSTGGGSSTGGSTGGGTTDTPGDSKVDYKTDARFADGYPKVMTDKENNKITVTYKLKDGVASEQNPAMIYNLVSSYNTFCDATTDAVIHGHFGMVTSDQHESDESEDYDFLKITDAKEHSAEYNCCNTINEGLVVYSVIDCNGVKSATPTKIEFDGDTTSSTVKDSIYPSDVFLNQKRDAVYIYIHSELDESKVATGEAFSVIQGDGTDSGAKVTNVAIIKNAVKYNGPLYSCVKLSLDQALSGGQYKLKCTGADIQDSNGNRLEGFQKPIVNTLVAKDKVYVSNDGHYMNFTVPLSYVMSYANYGDAFDDLKLYIDDKEIDHENWTFGVSVRDIIVQVYDKTLNDPKKIEIKSASNKTLCNAAQDPLEAICLSSMIKDTECEMSSSSYNSSEKSLSIKLSNGKDFSGYSFDACNFVVKIGEQNYRLRGASYIDENDENYFIKFSEKNLKHIDFSNVTEMSVKYDPIGLEDSCRAHYNFLSYNSGKPVPASCDIPVTIQK